MAADPAPTHPAALIRYVGTHNTKNGRNGQCHQLWNGGEPVDVTELEELDSLLDQPLFKYRAKAGISRADNTYADNSHDTEDKPPVDIDARLAVMRWQGKGDSAINITRRDVAASMLARGIGVEEVVRTIINATKACVADIPECKNWKWAPTDPGRGELEEQLVWESCFNFIVKHRTVLVTGWDKLRQQLQDILAAGKRPKLSRNAAGWHIRGYGESPNAEQPQAEPAADDGSPAREARTAKPTGWNYFDSTEVRPQHWLVKQLLPETGVGIMSGQWGSFRTTAALDLSIAVMTGQPFAGQYRIKRQGAVLYFALEGAGTLKLRLNAIARHRGAPEKLPFAWRGDCPLLTDKAAGQSIVKYIDEAAIHFEHAYGVPIVLIWVDTYITAAGLSSSGDDNDTAATQKAFNTLRFVAAHSGAFVASVDHLGKVMEAGTRGSSGKEGNADTVLATLAEREITGAVSNSRMAARKQRDGISGFEVPFTPETVELGLDEDGDPITAIVLSWGKQQRETKQPRKSKDRTLLAKTLVDVIAKQGFTFQPDPGGPAVQACHGTDLRVEFYKRRSANGTAKQQADKKRAAFNRTLETVREVGLILVRDVNGKEIIWPRQRA